MLTRRFAKFLWEYFRENEVTLFVVIGSFFLFPVLIPVAGALVAVLLVLDLIVALAQILWSIAKFLCWIPWAVAHHFAKRRADRRWKRDEVIDQARLTRLEESKPKPKPPPTRVELAATAQTVFQQDLELAEFHADELVKKSATAKAHKKYRDRLAQIMNQA